jgi:hypothetical protein
MTNTRNDEMEERILAKLRDVLEPYFEDGLLRIPYPEPGFRGDFLAVELTEADQEGFRIFGLEPPEEDEKDDEHVAYVRELRAYVRALFTRASI